jgi:hypothetical protein
MKSTLFIFILILISSVHVLGQKSDNYSFVKLYVTNEKNQVLLVKWEGEWEIAGSRYNDPVSVRQFANKIAEDMGVKVEDVKLCGLFTQKWQGNNNATIMHYYKAKYKGGTLKIPSDCTDIKWFSFDEAMKVIPYPIMTSMMMQINKNPEKVIGAAFERYRDKNNVSQHRVIEDFYVMN